MFLSAYNLSQRMRMTARKIAVAKLKIRKETFSLKQELNEITKAPRKGFSKRVLAGKNYNTR